MKNIQISEAIAKQMKESGIDSLIAIAKENFPLLFHKEKQWNDIGPIEGYYITTGCDIQHSYNNTENNEFDKNVHPTQKEAESTIALSQLRQWRDKANGAPLHEWVDWMSGTYKYCIVRGNNKIMTAFYEEYFQEMTFKTSEIRDQFLLDHKSLLETYFMINE